MTTQPEDPQEGAPRPATTQQVAARTRVLAALGCLAFGAFILAVALRLINLEPSRGVPHWIVGIAGMCFAIAGAAMLLPQRPSRVHDVLGALLFTLLATMGLWVGFAPGERNFSGGVSLGPVAVSGLGGETVGRVAFGAMGALVALLAIWAWRRAFMKRGGQMPAQR